MKLCFGCAETKRSEFPRFYFVSDPTLLEALSLGSDPPSVVRFFQSGLFDSLSDVTFDKASSCFMLLVCIAILDSLTTLPAWFLTARQPGAQAKKSKKGAAAWLLLNLSSRAGLLQVDRTKMLDMFSREGERVPFETPVDAKGNIEVWLQKLVDGMQARRLGRAVGGQHRLYGLRNAHRMQPSRGAQSDGGHCTVGAA